MSEFQPGVTDAFSPNELSPISRKQFLGLLAASAAFAAAGCTNYRDKGEIVPYTKKPEEVTPGVANLLRFHMYRMFPGLWNVDQNPGGKTGKG